jgi:hypothetical protein
LQAGGPGKTCGPGAVQAVGPGPSAANHVSTALMLKPQELGALMSMFEGRR